MAVEDLSGDQLETPYRPGGWTVRQWSTMWPTANRWLNRVRHALTEDWPAIFAYQENRWAELEDARAASLTSLDLLQALHTRWVRCSPGSRAGLEARLYPP